MKENIVKEWKIEIRKKKCDFLFARKANVKRANRNEAQMEKRK